MQQGSAHVWQHNAARRRQRLFSHATVMSLSYCRPLERASERLKALQQMATCTALLCSNGCCCQNMITACTACQHTFTTPKPLKLSSTQAQGSHTTGRWAVLCCTAHLYCCTVLHQAPVLHCTAHTHCTAQLLYCTAQLLYCARSLSRSSFAKSSGPIASTALTNPL